MSLTLSHQLTIWLKSKINTDFDENTVFQLKLSAANQAGATDVILGLDLIWFVVIHFDDSDNVKLSHVKELLQEPNLLIRFKQTLEDPKVKRLLAEFLLFNFNYLDALKSFIDFTKLNLPIDFISHALFIRRGNGADTVAINAERLKIVEAVLKSSFVLPANSLINTEGAVLRKVLLLDGVDNKFNVAQQLINAGYKLFNNNLSGNADVALALIDARARPECMAMILAHKDQFARIMIQIDDGQQNLADYYHWVKEDRETVKFLEELGVKRSAPKSSGPGL